MRNSYCKQLRLTVRSISSKGEHMPRKTNTSTKTKATKKASTAKKRTTAARGSKARSRKAA